MSLRELKSLNVGKELHLQGSHLRSGKMEDSKTASNQHLSVNTDLEALVRALQAENEPLKVQNHEIEGKLEVLEGAYEESIKVFQMLPAEDKASYSRVKDALKTLFRSVDIEELRGMEFHRLVETSGSVQELGMEIQRLGHRAFPSVTGNDLDHLLKDHFFQALLVWWQRKLGAPKVQETFQELFDRARMVEQREKQYAESAALHGNNDGNKQKSNNEKVTKFSSRPGRI